MAARHQTAEELIEGFQSGEEKAFNFLFREFYPALCFFSFRIVKNKEVAEEIAGDAFMRLWERRKGFLHPQAIKTFLYIVIKNESLTWIRSQQRNNARAREMNYLADEKESNILQHISAHVVYADSYQAMY